MAVYELNPPLDPALGPRSVAAAEDLLSQWFEAETVLVSSGRAAMLLWFDLLGFNRYVHRVATTRMISACVLDAITRRAFPVDAAQANEAEALVLYHQYGLPQKARPTQPHVLEDVCHAFFATASTGARPWLGEAAVFSLPKFFGAQSMVGGLVTRDAGLAEALRGKRDSFPARLPETRRRQAVIFRAPSDGTALEHVYLDRLLNPRLHDDELGGVPSSLSQMQAVGHARAEIMATWLDALPQDMAAQSRLLVGDASPYVLPFFAPIGRDEAAPRILAQSGLPPASYAIDVARDITAPVYRRGYLLPLHGAMKPAEVAALAHRIGDGCVSQA